MIISISRLGLCSVVNLATGQLLEHLPHCIHVRTPLPLWVFATSCMKSGLSELIPSPLLITVSLKLNIVYLKRIFNSCFRYRAKSINRLSFCGRLLNFLLHKARDATPELATFKSKTLFQSHFHRLPPYLLFCQHLYCLIKGMSFSRS